MTNELIDCDKYGTFEEAYLENSPLTENIIQKYDISITDKKMPVLHIFKPQYIAVKNPRIIENLSTFSITGEGGRITIFKEIFKTHVVIF